jgi:AraC-like DNA-binding protein
MNPETNNSVDFGPHRAILRALLVKAPATAQSFLQRFGLEASAVLNTNFFVSEETVTALWALVRDEERLHPLLVIEAASLFQCSDLGDRGWVLMTARNISDSANLFQRFWPELGLEVEDCGEWKLWRCTPSSDSCANTILYFVMIVLNFLNGHGMRFENEGAVTFPDCCKPVKYDFEELIRERIKNDIGTKIQFDKDSIALKLSGQSLTAVLKTADETVFQLFLQRCIKHEIQGDAGEKFADRRDIEIKIKRIMRRHLSSANFGSKDVCGELGVSIRTMERILAEEGMTLRALKQQVQQEAAEEMLAMGVRIKEVAAKIGFEDATAFTRAFHKWSGVTPSQFRKQKSDEK